MTRAVGCDLAYYEGSFRPETATQPIDFAIQKATEGMQYIDPLYDEIWEGVKQIAIRGAYHYQRSGVSWLAQADHFLETAYKHDYQIYSLDLEERNNTFSDTFFCDTRRIIDRWRILAPTKKIVLYTNEDGYKNLYIALTRIYPDAVQWLDSVDFWFAQPSTNADPILPANRKTWRIWQHSWIGTPARWGTTGFVDENRFNGTVDEMKEWAGILEAPPQEEINMLYEGSVKPTSVPYVNLRDAASPLGADIGDLYPNERITADALQNGWLHITSVNGVAKVGWASAMYLDYHEVAQPTQDKIEIFINGVKTFEMVGQITQAG